MTRNWLGNKSSRNKKTLAPLSEVITVGFSFLLGCSGLAQLAESPLAQKLGWNGNNRDDLARLLVATNKQRIADLPVSWDARKTAILIRNFAPLSHATRPLKFWTVICCVVEFLSPLRVPETVLIAEEIRMMEGVTARGV